MNFLPLGLFAAGLLFSNVTMDDEEKRKKGLSKSGGQPKNFVGVVATIASKKSSNTTCLTTN